MSSHSDPPSNISIKVTFIDPILLEKISPLYQAHLEETEDDSALDLHEDQMVMIAQEEDKLLGFASLSHNTLHPNWVSPFVLVHPLYRRQGIGKALHEALWQTEQYKLETGFKADCSQENEESIGFLTALGYHKRLDSHSLYFEINEEDLQADLKIPPIGTDLKCASFQELQSSRNKLLNFLVARYRDEHDWSPPIAASHPIWKEVIFDDLNPTLSFALISQDQIIAAVTAESSEDMIHLFWAYASPEYAHDERVSMLRYLIARQLKAGLDQELYAGDIEIDSSDKVLSSLLDWFPQPEAFIWGIYQKSKNNQN